MPKTQQPPALHSAPVLLDGSQQQCPFFNATLSGVGECEAFPDSGSKVTLISKARVPASMIIPWTEPPLVVVGGSTVLPVGAAFLKISIGPATGVVEAAVLEDNVLPLILGEDWFSAAQARLIFEPPEPTQLQHRATNVTITASQKLVPRMANAVISARSSLFPQARPNFKDCLQRDTLPSSEQPPWQALAAQTWPSSTSITSDALPSDTVPIRIYSDIAPAQIGSQLTLSQRSVIKDRLAEHNAVFARHDDDLGHFIGMQHRIDLLHDTLPYSRSPYQYAAEDRQFLQTQVKKLPCQGSISEHGSLRPGGSPNSLRKLGLRPHVIRHPGIWPDGVRVDEVQHRYDYAQKGSFLTFATVACATIIFLILVSALITLFAMGYGFTYVTETTDTAEPKVIFRSGDVDIRVLSPNTPATPVGATKKTTTTTTTQKTDAYCVNGRSLGNDGQPALINQQSALAERIRDTTMQPSEAAANSEAAQGARKERYDRSHRSHTFTVGDMVWVRRQTPVANEKMAPRFNGVYRLIEQLTPSIFRALRVSCLTSRLVNQPRTVHVSQLKPYVPPVSPVIEQQPVVNAETTPASAANFVATATASTAPTHSMSTEPPRRLCARVKLQRFRAFVWVWYCACDSVQKQLATRRGQSD